MMGDQPDRVGDQDDQYEGLIPRTVRHLFSLLKENRAMGGKSFSVYCSYMEIYGERVHDLLKPYKSDYQRDPLDMVKKRLDWRLGKMAAVWWWSRISPLSVS